MSSSHSALSQIVLVEDNPGDVGLLRHSLRESGRPFELHVLADGEAALQYVKTHCGVDGVRQPCLIVLDLHLPRYGGEAVLRAIRQEPSLASVRVAVLTTQSSPQEQQRVEELGVRLYRRKPADLDEYFTLAQELITLCHEPADARAVSG